MDSTDPNRCSAGTQQATDRITTNDTARHMPVTAFCYTGKNQGRCIGFKPCYADLRVAAHAANALLTSGCAMTKGRRQWSPIALETAKTPITLTPFQNRIWPPAASTRACRQHAQMSRCLYLLRPCMRPTRHCQQLGPVGQKASMQGCLTNQESRC